eukprot:TRINITY_DN23589_c0_g1_i1.p1 TRINITY_DN23589_c0_g1~~TRINITY_DN23589_c0_g1_i1.p1  ORF type:complete len:160 (-),score=32.09 TRINITY_DN23589_c0_g1_i1:35-514(-)
MNKSGVGTGREVVETIKSVNDIESKRLEDSKASFFLTSHKAPNDPSRSDIDENSSDLKAKINELKAVNNYYLKNNKKLEKLNEELKRKLHNIEDANKNLMKLFSTKNLSSEDNSFINMSIKNMQTEMEYLMRENADLRAKLKSTPVSYTHLTLPTTPYV